eukprot:TRINITY_DN2172_c0_g1_i7.p5 TRINITY_DN2172_c0_g1~~TRINITY_DN2172_c0_g1_i7.p5  ORF type:complete len:163 (-),score=28.06 TRINITY_DN2172_c0_g1_i7:1402-1890(-)
MECPICLREWSDPDCLPRSLFCGHSFCDQCLVNLLLKKKTLRCPTCDEVHSVPQGLSNAKDGRAVVSSLPKNFSLIAVLNEKSTNLPANKVEKKRLPEEEAQYEFTRCKGICEKHELPLHSYMLSTGEPTCDKCIHQLPKGTPVQLIPSVSLHFISRSPKPL